MEETQPSVAPATQPPKPRRAWSGQLPLILALVIIGGMLIAWKPWEQAPSGADRTITVTGEAEITAEPDEYIFTPQYEFEAADRKAAQDQATTKTNQVVTELKKLGVAERQIKTDTNNYKYFYPTGRDNNSYTAMITVTVDDKALAQKVQDYLLTTTPEDSVTPRAQFSKAKRQQLTSQGRDQATKDAKAKADQSAKNLGFDLGKVKAVKDQPNSFFEPYGRTLELGADSAAGNAADSAPILQGEQDLSYQVTVTYFVK